MVEPTKAELKQIELLTEAAVATAAESKLLAHELAQKDAKEASIRRKQRRADRLMQLLLLTILATQWWFEHQNDQIAGADRERIEHAVGLVEANLQLVEDCVSPDRRNSDCQKNSRARQAATVDAIAAKQLDQLIIAMQCSKEPANVDNQSLEDCILAETELLRKQREQTQ